LIDQLIDLSIHASIDPFINAWGVFGQGFCPKF